MQRTGLLPLPNQVERAFSFMKSVFLLDEAESAPPPQKKMGVFTATAAERDDCCHMTCMRCMSRMEPPCISKPL